MLSGDPGTFGIWCDLVDSWSNEKFKNGCLGYIIGGAFIWSTRSTLGDDLAGLYGLSCMSNSAEDGVLFEMSGSEIYAELYKRAYPEMESGAEKSDFKHIAAPMSLLDEGYSVFLVESGAQGRLLYGRDGMESFIGEVLLRRGEYQAAVREADGKFTR